MGVFEMDAFSRGTFAMVSAVANSYALTIVGGGDTDAAVHRAGEYAKISYISTGGGAFLELLEGKNCRESKSLRKEKRNNTASFGVISFSGVIKCANLLSLETGNYSKLKMKLLP